MELITLAVLDDRHADRPVTLVDCAGVPAVAKRYANVLLADTCHVRLIDFDRFQAAGAGRDVANWGAWIWATMLLQGREPSWEPANDFAASYLLHRPEAGSELGLTKRLHRAAALLRIAQGWSAWETNIDSKQRVVEEANQLPVSKWV